MPAITENSAISRATRAIIRSAGAKLAGRERGQDRQIHRESYDVHDHRAQVARKFADGTKAGTLAWIDAFVRTAREFDLFTRQKGKPRPLRDSGIHILDVVLRNHWHDFRTGRIDPALSQIMRATGYVRQTVVDALKRLAEHGFLDWVRRTERIANPIPGGPTRQQVNNAYFVDLAALAAKAGKNVRDRFLQLLARAKARVVLAAKVAPSPPPAPPSPPPRPAPSGELAAALAALRNAVEEQSASLEKRLSPASGV